MRIAVYAGSFDPITLGHLSVIERACPLFEQLIVLVAVNPNKLPTFSVAERLAMIRRSLPLTACGPALPRRTFRPVIAST